MAPADPPPPEVAETAPTASAKAARRRIWWTVIWIALLAVSVLAEPRVDDLALVVGESATLDFPVGADVQISRRGVVDLFHAGDGRWLVTALRAGVIVLSAGEGETGRRSVVRVAPLDQAPARVDEELPDWLCATPGVRCDRDARVVDGTLSDPGRFAQARTLCTRGACRFQAVLAEAARAGWEARLRALVPFDASISLSAAGVVRARVPCGERLLRPDERSIGTSRHESDLQGTNPRTLRRDELRAALRGRVDDDDLLVLCADLAAPPSYRLETKILRVAASQLAALGFAGTSTLGAAGPPWHLDMALTTRLEAARRAHRLEIVGEPAMRLVAGLRAEARSGGEFQVALHEPRAGEAHAVWKPFGLVLVATASPRDERSARLSYELSLSAREASGVSAHGVKGDIDLTLGIPTIAAALDLVSAEGEDVSQPLLANLPILGPLFRLKTTGEQTSRVFAWFKLAADEGSGLRDKATAWPEDR